MQEKSEGRTIFWFLRRKAWKTKHCYKKFCYLSNVVCQLFLRIKKKHEILCSPPSSTTPWAGRRHPGPSGALGAWGLSSVTPPLRHSSGSRKEGGPRYTPPTWAHLSNTNTWLNSDSKNTWLSLGKEILGKMRQQEYLVGFRKIGLGLKETLSQR